MNEHFKKHLEASYTRAFAECARTGHKVGDLDAIFNSIAMATFAELIVRECMKVALDERVSDEEIDKSDDIEDRCYLRGNNGGIVDAVVAIKQHFGIEE